MKKILSLIMSFVMLISGISAFSSVTYAASYSQELKEKGFSDSYVTALTSLHEKYPNWNFVPFVTGLDWNTAVAGERSKHSNQVIQKQSSLSNDYYCNDSTCYKNGNYIVQEGSSWVSASESAVKYYMDPRNWLTEKYIFQFESTAYDSSQTKAGVEAILKGTWMYNSLITYKDTSGATKTYDSKTKYSDAILAAAKSSGMSAYYLASKIKQENGGATASATAVCGTKAPFQGIYNYYNIGANTGASDGLEWAAGYLKVNDGTTASLYSKYDSSTKKVSGKIADLKDKQYMTYRGEYGDYYYVRLYTKNGNNSFSEGKSGYVLKSALRTRYFNLERPWTNPYKAIVGGAQRIKDMFGAQNTGYLQKFNVSKASGNLYTHEYMTNVQGAAQESSMTYSAYSSAGMMKDKKTFYIPVFSGMPSSKCTVTASQVTPKKVSGVKITGTSTSSVTLKWSKTANANGYYIYDSKSKKIATISSGSTVSKKISSLSAGKSYSFYVAAYSKGSSTKVGPKSSKVTAVTKPKTPTLSSVKSKQKKKIKVTWKKVGGSATGYQIYWARDSKFKKVVAKTTVKKQSSTSYTGKNMTRGKKYYVKVRAYKTIDGKKYYSSWSKVKSVKCK